MAEGKRKRRESDADDPLAHVDAEKIRSHTSLLPGATPTETQRRCLLCTNANKIFSAKGDEGKGQTTTIRRHFVKKHLQAVLALHPPPGPPAPAPVRLPFLFY